MDKLHTHYDNLKISRFAPPEVIRAAYKVLTQKYHPDKNPGDERAARIMAILNSAYNTLSDEQRRKEHDEWIAAEEWEIAWLESTHQEEGGGNLVPHPQNRPASKTELVAYQPSRDPKWWLILAVCIGLGWTGSVMTQSKPFASTISPPEAKADERQPAALAISKTAENKVVVLSQVMLPELAGRCGNGSAERPPLAPNGESWPAHSGYLEGYKVGNMGGNTELTLDNTRNAVPVYIKLFDVESRQNVRHVYVGIRDKFVLENLTAGNYEVRRQDLGSARMPLAECKRRIKRVQ